MTSKYNNCTATFIDHAIFSSMTIELEPTNWVGAEPKSKIGTEYTSVNKLIKNIRRKRNFLFIFT